MNSIVHTFFEFQVKLKIYHWQTKIYSRHKASDELLGSISDKVDSFVEVLQGRTNTRVKFQKKQTIDLENVSDKQAVQLLKEFADWLSTDLDRKMKGDTELINIRDEMLAIINQTLYLFTFN